jgi:arginase family enzyme
MKLRRFWFQFEGNAFELPPGLAMGCGITAWSEADALELLQSRVFKGVPSARIKSIHANIDVSTLDPNHVRPNMGVPVERGAWFPPDYPS